MAPGEDSSSLRSSNDRRRIAQDEIADYDVREEILRFSLTMKWRATSRTISLLEETVERRPRVIGRRVAAGAGQVERLLG